MQAILGKTLQIQKLFIQHTTGGVGGGKSNRVKTDALYVVINLAEVSVPLMNLRLCRQSGK